MKKDNFEFKLSSDDHSSLGRRGVRDLVSGNLWCEVSRLQQDIVDAVLGELRRCLLRHYPI